MVTITARVYPYAIICVVLCGIVIALSGDAVNIAIDYYLIAGFVVLFGVLMFVMSKNRIVLAETGISQKLLLKTKEMLWADVYKSSLKIRANRATLIFTWFIQSYSGKVIEIPLGHYSRKNMEAIAAALVANCPNALIDGNVKNFAVGKFSWYIF